MLAVILVMTILIASQRRIGRIAAIIWSIIWIAAIVAILIPDATTRIANTVGIHRGADLVLYIVAILMSAGFISMYMRLRQVRREFTLLVRKIAILETMEQNGDRTNPQA